MISYYDSYTIKMINLSKNDVTPIITIYSSNWIYKITLIKKEKNKYILNPYEAITQRCNKVYLIFSKITNLNNKF